MKETDEVRKAIDSARKQGRVIVEKGHRVVFSDEVPVMLVPLGATEKEFQTWVIARAQEHGWLVYHTFNSKRSQPGYLDLTMVNRTFMIVELKATDGKCTEAQLLWIEALQFAGVEVSVWTPADAEMILARLKQG